MFFAALVLAVDLRLELVRHSLTGVHYRYREYVEGRPTENYVMSRSAVAIATASTGGGYATALLNINGRNARREIHNHIAYDYDEATGALIRTVPLFFRGKTARVFDPNPVASQNDPSLRDGNDTASAVPNSAYRAVELPDVAASGPLRGPNVALVDREPPGTQPPDAAGALTFDREADGFEDVNAYFHIDRNQRYLQSLGYSGVRSVAAYPIEVDAHAQDGADSSFFLPSLTELGRGTLVFGEGGTDDAEDADLLIHEYGHAILEWIAPGTFGGPFAGQPRGLAEGFGDYWAYSQHVATRIASGRDPFCFADWDARCAEDDPSQQCSYPSGTDCLRRLDSTRTMADYDSREQSGSEHRNGAIWSSALREIHERVGKTVADTVVLESIFDMPAVPSYAAAAHRLVEADQQLYGGAHVAAICAAMTARGITTDCAFTPRGELTHFQSSDHAVTIPDNQVSGITSSLTISDARVVEELFVRVDIDHSSRGDLRIELIAPDGTTVLLKQTSPDGGGDVRTTYGLTSTPAQPLTVFRGRSAQGVWQLRVTDLRRLDVGTLRSWDLVLKFAGSVPLSERPHVGRAQMIPVVGHLFGIGGTEFVSDVWIANAGNQPRTATLIFTPAGEDGYTSFSAIDVALAAGQTLALHDVVATAFLTAGSGSLEVLGDVLVMSRTYFTREDGGTLSQQVPANFDTTVRGSEPLLLVAMPDSAKHRYNCGIVETGGGRGTVFVGYLEGEGRLVAIEPFSHTQFPTHEFVQQVRVESGNPRIAAYLSQIDAASGDPMLVPAMKVRSDERPVLAPVIASPAWRSDFWSGSTMLADFITARLLATAREDVTRTLVLPPSGASSTTPDVIGGWFQSPNTLGVLALTLPPGFVAATRIVHEGTSELVPFLTPGGAEQQLLFIESGPEYRTNIGVAASEPVLAEVVVYDAGGRELERRLLSTTGGVAQLLVTPRVADGRAVVTFLAGRGRAYASVIDNRSGDATFIEGQ